MNSENQTPNQIITTGDRWTEIGMKTVEVFLTGFCLAAGGAAYGALTRKVSEGETGIQTDSNVISMNSRAS